MKYEYPKSLVLVDGVPLPAGTCVAEMVNGRVVKIRAVAQVDHKFRSPVNLRADDEGRTWCRSWTGEAVNALRIVRRLRCGWGCTTHVVRVRSDENVTWCHGWIRTTSRKANALRAATALR